MTKMLLKLILEQHNRWHTVVMFYYGLMAKSLQWGTVISKSCFQALKLKRQWLSFQLLSRTSPFSRAWIVKTKLFKDFSSMLTNRYAKPITSCPAGTRDNSVTPRVTTSAYINLCMAQMVYITPCQNNLWHTKIHLQSTLQNNILIYPNFCICI